MYASSGRSMRTSPSSPSEALGLVDRSGHQFHVEIEPNFLDVPMLLASEQVAGAADLEVAHRDAEPRAESGVLRDRLQPFVRFFRQRAFGREEQVRVGPLVSAAHSTSQLV